VTRAEETEVKRLPAAAGAGQKAKAISVRLRRHIEAVRLQLGRPRVDNLDHDRAAQALHDTVGKRFAPVTERPPPARQG
jgi:hypothetical protein